MQTEHDTALDTAKINLMIRPDSVFITTILFSLKFSWDENIPTACTNGVNLRVNPKFFLELSKEERMFVLAHEAYHVAFQHMERVEGRRFIIWNYATDYVINWMLKEAGFVVDENKWLVDKAYKGMSSYEVYDILINKDEDELPQNFQEDFEELPSDAEVAKSIEESIEDTIIKASMRAKMENQAGTIPGEVEIFLDKLVAPQLPWHRILQNLLNGVAQEDHSWQRPNRRYLPNHYMPTRHSESLGEIAVAVDLSGSISQKQADVFISEIHSIHKTVRPTKTKIIGFDTEISCENEITQDHDLLNLKFKGGGGTAIKPVYDWAKSNKPKALIIFTDGYFTKYEECIPTTMPIFWIIHDNSSFKIKRGKVITYKE